MKTVVVVGASSSIGGAVVARFLSASTQIVATYSSHNDIAPAENLRTLELDLANDQSIVAFANELSRCAVAVDTAIFLSGLLPGKSLQEYQSSEVDRVMAVNFTGQAKVVARLLPLLNAGSQVIMFSSIAAQRGSYDPIYAAAKGAILSFVKSLASTLAPRVRINVVAPGLIQDSTMFCDMDPPRRELHRLETPRKQLLSMEELAAVLHDLSQPHWAHLNGACIDLNGGRYVR